MELKLLFVCNEGFIFGIFALGIFLSFQWLKFPDLTPDGSFVLGPCVFIKSCLSGVPLFWAALLGISSGFALGIITASFNKFLKIPAIIAGLITSTATYSLGWLILDKPNQPLNGSGEFFSYNMTTNSVLLCVVLLLLLAVILFLFNLFGSSIWGLKLRALGENEKIAKGIHIRPWSYYIITLGVSNALVALSGILFIQRSYSVDINMGTGQTIIGLIAMIFGVLITANSHKIYMTTTFIILGAILYKLIIQVTLELGFPAESFRLISAFLIVTLFFVMKKFDTTFLDKLKWS